MGVKYCAECGKLCADHPSGLCNACQRVDEENAIKVYEYLREVKSASIEEIHEVTGVKHKTILRLIKTGRVATDAEVAISYPCETCGEPITDGRLCLKCSKKMAEQMRSKAQEMTDAYRNKITRMYYNNANEKAEEEKK
ncbi:hypothetical protein [Acetonema longum]|uniref:Flagellar protein n=1 Tax=Acetonema longum DSM 6540 TaxID=1009370 RepID=F7NNU1_9FIRM|nr:hypothetical protein [Acetonema longum]EGO62275.1 flagellar protein [Acetonema longum DSM 6540]